MADIFLWYLGRYFWPIYTRHNTSHTFHRQFITFLMVNWLYFNTSYILIKVKYILILYRQLMWRVLKCLNIDSSFKDLWHVCDMYMTYCNMQLYISKVNKKKLHVFAFHGHVIWILDLWQCQVHCFDLK